MTEQEFDRLRATVDRSGTWGVEDRRGALNFISPDATLRGLLAVREGKVISLARPIHPVQAPGQGASMKTSCDALTGQAWHSVNEWVSLVPHGRDGMTHLDSFGHFYWNRATYNGAVLSYGEDTGVPHHDVLGSAGGIFTRGVLLDLRGAADQSLLQAGQSCPLPVLKTMLSAAGVTLESGDALFIRLNITETADGDVITGGLGLDCAQFLHDSEVGLVVSDAGLDSEPSEVDNVLMPWHILTLTAMGIHVIDLANLDPLARLCTVRGSSTFAAVIAPLPLAGATGSPVNPLAIL